MATNVDHKEKKKSSCYLLFTFRNSIFICYCLMTLCLGFWGGVSRYVRTQVTAAWISFLAEEKQLLHLDEYGRESLFTDRLRNITPSPSSNSC